MKIPSTIKKSGIIRLDIALPNSITEKEIREKPPSIATGINKADSFLPNKYS